MHRKKIVLVFLCIVLALCGCGGIQTQQGEDGTSKVTVPAANTSATPIPEPVEDFSDVEKHLVWYHDQSIFQGTDPQVFVELNKLLLARGYDFVVDFETMQCRWSTEVYGYQKKLRDYKEQGKQVDLIFTGWAMGTVQDTYDNAVRDGLLLPLDDYFEKEEGQNLYEAFPASVWNMMRREGKVYGVCENAWYGKYYSAVLNREILEKYNVKAPDTFSVEEFLRTVQEVYVKSKEAGEKLFPVYLEEDAVCATLGYFKTGDFWIRQGTDGTASFVNPYADEEAQELFAVLEKYGKEFGGFGTWEEYRVYDFEEKEIASFQSTRMDLSGDNNYSYYPAYTYEPQEMFYSYPMHNTIQGVASWATYPEEAKILLNLITTDEEVINLLYYGIKGKHYQIKDGHAITRSRYIPQGSGVEFRVNEYFVYPSNAESANIKEYYQKNLQNVIFLPDAAENLTNGALTEEEEAIAELFQRAEGLWLGKCENAKQTAEEICMELKAANVDEVLQNLTERLLKEEY